ncbi:ABC transporter ATP-binding protein [Phreatobacter sp.]|uniref:ABC transporter ATP-binding protein n=1 Tax=Phreatobacter sp. TaxID=1966341 RepID=UPI0025F62D1A|nr:ABC transporter ATP-binding protein [Phreatobacter sp.]
MTSPLVELKDLTVDFPVGGNWVRALHGVSLTIRRGEALGLVGESGSGKSVTWLAATKLLPAKARIAGEVLLDGRPIQGLTRDQMAGVRGKRVALIFQDPTSSLNPVHRVGTQIAEAVRLHRGFDAAAARAEARRLLDRVHIPSAARRIDDYPHELSGGTNQRVMIAVALAGEPDLLVADEPTTALDVTIQAQILDLLAEMRRETGMALVLISHDLGIVADITDRVAVMYAGRIVEEAPVDALFDDPRHPYTQGLLAALPDVGGPRRRLTAIHGQVPNPAALPPGCSFAPRCPAAIAGCVTAIPSLDAVAADRRTACFRARPATSLEIAA